MTITTSMNTFIARAGGKIETPKLPNDLIMGIIKLADGGKTTHEHKMVPVLQSIKQTGGWFNWHEPEDDLEEHPMECIVTGGGVLEYGNDDVGKSWDQVLDGKCPWMWELLKAELSYQ